MDQHYNWMPGQDGREWQCERKVKSIANDRFWDLELAIRRASLTDKPFDNTEWILHLVRADGFAGDYFFAWKYSWFVNCHEFPAVFFDPQAPAFRFVNLGEVRKGDPDVKIEVAGKTATPQAVQVNLRGVGADGTILYDQTRDATVRAGERADLAFAEKLMPPEKGMNLELRATVTAGGKTQTLYEQKIPAITPWTKADEERRLAEIERRKHLITGMNATFAYYPSAGCGRASIDNDIFGMPERFASARDFRVSVQPAARGGKAIASATGTIDAVTLTGAAPVPVPDLPEGDYEAAIELIGPQGRVVDTQRVPFARRKYPWEGNAIGKDKIVIPPFTPLVVEGDRIRPWGRTYVIATGGLLKSLVHMNEDLLAEPIRLEAEEAGRPVVLEGQAGTLKVAPADANGHTVTVDAAGRLGSVPVKVRGEMEYDGFYLVDVTLEPTQAVNLARLDLVIPLWSGADTAYVCRSPMIAKGSYCGDFPAGEGVVWDSRALGSDPRWGTFVPRCFVGNGDKGIVWEAETDAGWNPRPDSACVVLERDGGRPRMRIRMVHAPVEVKEPRRIRFALWAMPTKPMPSNWRAVAWCYPDLHVAWDVNSGYREYGDGTDSFTLPSDEHFLKLRQAVATPASPNDKSWHKHWWLDRYVRAGKPLVLYGSNMGAGMAMKELEAYAGEWLGCAWPENPTPENPKGFWNLQESIQYNEPRQLTAAFVNVCESYEDCYLWYHQKYVRLTGLQGTFWDNNNLCVVWTPERGTGRIDYRWDVFSRRRMVKRLATMCWLERKAPWWVENTGGMQLSFNTLSAQCEGDFYIPSDTTLYEYLPMDKMRAFLCARRGTIPMLWPQWTATTDEKRRLMGRSINAVRLLCDIGAHPLARADQAMLNLLDAHVDFFGPDEDIECIGYWRSAPLARFQARTAGAKPPLISVYRNRRLHRSLIVIANPNGQPLEGSLWLNHVALVANPLTPEGAGNRTLTDIEKNQCLGYHGGMNAWLELMQWNNEARRYEERPLALPPLDHRLLVLQ
jgi:hypothetical protein